MLKSTFAHANSCCLILQCYGEGFFREREQARACVCTCRTCASLEGRGWWAGPGGHLLTWLQASHLHGQFEGGDVVRRGDPVGTAALPPVLHAEGGDRRAPIGPRNPRDVHRALGRHGNCRPVWGLWHWGQKDLEAELLTQSDTYKVNQSETQLCTHYDKSNQNQWKGLTFNATVTFLPSMCKCTRPRITTLVHYL